MSSSPPKFVPDQSKDEICDYSNVSGPFYRMFKDEERQILLSKSGLASIQPTTIPLLLQKCAEKMGDRIVLATEWPEPQIDESKPDPKDRIPASLELKDWRKWTFKDFFQDVENAAKGFIELGHLPLETVSILGFNSPFWIISSYAGIYAGGIANGLYSTDSEEQIVYKTEHSDSSIVLVDTASNYKKFAKSIDKMNVVKAVVVWKDVNVIPNGKRTELVRKNGTKVVVISWDELLRLGAESKTATQVLGERVKSQKPGMCCTLAYTSGTTGMPKGVMITHDNIIFQGHVMGTFMPEYFHTHPNILLSYLPLSHVAGYMLDVASIINTPNYSNFKAHSEIYFARSYDLKAGSFVNRLQTVRPTAFLGVPRVWEKIQEKLKEAAPKDGVVKHLGDYAKRKMLSYQQNLQLGGSGDAPWGITFSKYLLGKIHKKLGLDRVQYALSGAAPLKLETQLYWASLGICICEAYGMSENTGATTANSMVYHQFGCVGRENIGCEVKILNIDEAGSGESILKECPGAESLTSFGEENQGELCYRGRHIMLGYMANKKLGEEHIADLKKKNEAAIDGNGFLHSGDKGFKTKQGMYKVTGRYKELIIGAGGENIAPVPIEDDIKARCEIISNVMMLGNDRKFNVALMTLKVEGATGEVPGSNILAGPAKALGAKWGITTVEEAVRHDGFVEHITLKLKETNSNGDVVLNNTFKIQKFSILHKDFSVETSELTPTLKLKRGHVENHHKDHIEKMYSSDKVYVPFEPKN